jgi:hypothetical protein
MENSQHNNKAREERKKLEALNPSDSEMHCRKKHFNYCTIKDRDQQLLVGIALFIVSDMLDTPPIV